MSFRLLLLMAVFLSHGDLSAQEDQIADKALSDGGASVQDYAIVTGLVPTQPGASTSVRSMQQLRVKTKPIGQGLKLQEVTIDFRKDVSELQTSAGAYDASENSAVVLMHASQFPSVLSCLKQGEVSIRFAAAPPVASGQRKLKLFLLSNRAKSGKSTSGASKDVLEIPGKVTCHVENVSDLNAVVCWSGGYAGCTSKDPIKPGETREIKVDYHKHIWLERPGGSRKYHVDDVLFGEKYEIYVRNGKLDMVYTGLP